MSNVQQEYRILVPLVDPKIAGDLIKLASGILHEQPGKAIVLGVVEAPDKDSLSDGALRARAQRRLLREVTHLGQVEKIEVKTIVRMSRQAGHGIQEAVAEEGANLLILGWKGESRRADRIFGTTIDELVKNPPCDIAVVKQRGLGECESILMPVRGGPHADLALRLVSSIAKRFNAKVTVMHIEPESPLEHENRPFADFISRSQGSRRIGHLMVRSHSVEEAILAEAKKYQLVVMGATAHPSSADTLFGSIAETVAAKAEATVMVVKTHAPIDLSIFEERPDSLSLVDKWFGENTFHGREFNDVDELIELKRRQGITISLGLPSLNEEGTIGSVIRVIKGELMDKKPLLDEMAVIDGGSTDRTVEIARGYGVPVYFQRDILPQYGSYLGKGEALWKGLYVLKGDIMVWVDTDIRNIHPKFIYGIVGPLLKEERIKFVKGFYGRPITHGDSTYDTLGERLTELTARPLLNLFFPALSGLVEPLGGEYAGRREVFEQLPLFTGCGVDLGLLIDILKRFGLMAIGQSDLEERVHRNQPLSSLSQRAFALVQVVMKRLEAQNQVRLLEEAIPTMKLIRLERERFFLEMKEIGEVERSPMATIAEYIEKKSARP